MVSLLGRALRKVEGGILKRMAMVVQRKGACMRHLVSSRPQLSPPLWER